MDILATAASSLSSSSSSVTSDSTSSASATIHDPAKIVDVEAFCETRSPTSTTTTRKRKEPESVQWRKETLEPWYQHYIKLKDTCRGYLAEDYVVQTVRIAYPTQPNDSIMLMCCALRKLFTFAIPPYNKKFTQEIVSGMKAYRDLFKLAINTLHVGTVESISTRDLCCGWSGYEEKKKISERKRKAPIPKEEEGDKKAPLPHIQTEAEQQDNGVSEMLQNVLRHRKRIKLWSQQADEMEQKAKRLREQIAENQNIVADLLQTMYRSLLQEE